MKAKFPESLVAPKWGNQRKQLAIRRFLVDEWRHRGARATD
jgi:hypothetical protein